MSLEIAITKVKKIKSESVALWNEKYQGIRKKLTEKINETKILIEKQFNEISFLSQGIIGLIMLVPLSKT
jgi:hypothetical protein